MADNDDDDVKIFQPDTTLAKKLGGAKLDQLFSPKAIETAQQAITTMSDQFYTESVVEIKKIELAVQSLAASSKMPAPFLEQIISSTFSLKSAAGLGGYDLIAKLAKSFHAHTVMYSNVGTVTTAQLAIMQWFVASLKQMLSLKIKGSGGALGEAILAELNKLDAKAGFVE